MQKLFWLREHGPRMVLPHTRGKPVTFLRDEQSEEWRRKTPGVWLLRADCGKAREGHTTRCL